MLCDEVHSHRFFLLFFLNLIWWIGVSYESLSKRVKWRFYWPVSYTERFCLHRNQRTNDYWNHIWLVDLKACTIINCISKRSSITRTIIIRTPFYRPGGFIASLFMGFPYVWGALAGCGLGGPPGRLGLLFTFPFLCVTASGLIWCVVITHSCFFVCKELFLGSTLIYQIFFLSDRILS